MAMTTNEARRWAAIGVLARIGDVKDSIRTITAMHVMDGSKQPDEAKADEKLMLAELKLIHRWLRRRIDESFESRNFASAVKKAGRQEG